MAEGMTTVTRTTLTAAFNPQLRTYRIEGDGQPGDKHPAERKLCHRVGASRVSLWEALNLRLMALTETPLRDGAWVVARLFCGPLPVAGKPKLSNFVNSPNSSKCSLPGWVPAQRGPMNCLGCPEDGSALRQQCEGKHILGSPAN